MNRLKECREAAKLSQKYVAVTLGLSGPSVSNWESGKTKPAQENLCALSELYGVSVDYLLGRTDSKAQAFPPNLTTTAARLTHRVPLYGDVAAGAPVYADDEIRGYVDAPCDADYALTIKGDSMYPDYHDGDIVYILRREDVRDGEVAVVLVDDEATLKRVYKRHGGASLVSINPKYAPIDVSAEYGGVRIIGVPCGYTRMFRMEEGI